MGEVLDKIKYVLPVTAAVVLFCIMSLVITPLLVASPHDVPFAIVSLDKGAGAGMDEANIGDLLVESLTSDDEDDDANGISLGQDSDDAEGDDSTDTSSITWTELATEEDAERAIESNEYYGALVIPEDFTAAYAYNKIGIGEAPTIRVILNRAKNPTLAATIKNTVEELLLGYGIGADVEIANDADVGDGTLAPTLTVPMLTIALTIMTLIGSLLVSLLQWPRLRSAGRGERAVISARQIVYAVALSAVVTLLALAIQAGFAGMDLPFAQLFSYLWFSSFCLMVAAIGLSNLLLPVGAVIAAGTFGLGMPTAVLAPEMLPQFWVHWVYPWAPQRFMGEGMRSIIFLGTPPATSDVTPLLVALGVGVVAMVIACIVPARKRKEAEAT